MTRPDLHDTAFALLAIAIAATVIGPTGPDWVRWFGLCLAVPAIAMFIATAPRSEQPHYGTDKRKCRPGRWPG